MIRKNSRLTKMRYMDEEKKVVTYEKMPRRNCGYCKFYAEAASSCTHPKNQTIAVFHPIMDQDCPLLKIQIKEKPIYKDPAFQNKYCIPMKCAFYNFKGKVCMQNSQCPVDIDETEFENLDLKNNN